MKWQLLAAPLILTACTTTTPAHPPGTTTWTSQTLSITSSAPTGVDPIAAQARQQIEDLHASWLPYVADVTYLDGVLRVALQIDRKTDQEMGLKVAKAVATNVRLGDPALRSKIPYVEVVDGV